MTATDNSRALIPAQQTALQVDAKEAESFAGQLMKHAQAGGPLFPKDMTQSQAVQMARLSLAYGLDPIAGELILYQGRPYVTIDGRVRKAQENAAYDGLECNPATDDERKAFRCGEDEHLWIARVWRKDRRLPFVGYGRAAGKGDRNPVSQTYAQEMAQKRAKARALRDAFAMPLPSYEDDAPDNASRRDFPPHRTGPVIEGESRVIDADGVIVSEGEPDESGPTASQIKKIHTLVGRLGWTDADYRVLLRDAFAVGSSKDLPMGQAAALSECLEALVARSEEEGRAVRIQDAVAAMRRNLDKMRQWDEESDPGYARSKERDERQDDEPTTVDADPADPEQAEHARWVATFESTVKGTRLEDASERAAFLYAFTQERYPNAESLWTDDFSSFLADASEAEVSELIARATAFREKERRDAQAQRVDQKTRPEGPRASKAQIFEIEQKLKTAAPSVIHDVGEIDLSHLSPAEAEHILGLLHGKA